MYYFGAGASSGIKAGTDLDKTKIEKISNLQVISLLPDNFIDFNDSIFNKKTNTYVPAFYAQLGVSVPTEKNISLEITSMLSYFICMLTVLAAIIVFILIIISINNSNIFSWKNVSRLRWLGGLLVVSFITSVIPAFISFHILTKSFAVEGYSMHIHDFISIITLVLGVLSYIVAEIFAIGLRLKEEQDLTI
ncbi:DUF2975 domain-containing protein [Bacteroides sp. 519]|uniref:DUF2975 domain-containing protein n=1 Tax=Bacteroides sp. 519 TaxID=2302937 RepID=UPI0013D25107|nr:DUF2975 domain-containing protein [Bacteroides sp. 519]